MTTATEMILHSTAAITNNWKHHNNNNNNQGGFLIKTLTNGNNKNKTKAQTTPTKETTTTEKVCWEHPLFTSTTTATDKKDQKQQWKQQLKCLAKYAEHLTKRKQEASEGSIENSSCYSALKVWTLWLLTPCIICIKYHIGIFRITTTLSQIIS